MKYLYTLFLVSMLNQLSFAQCNPNLEQYIIGFDNIESSSFSFLDHALNDTRIVGYGEDTHGTSEFTTLAKELMKYLSEKHDFKVLIIETGFGEGQYLNDFIQGKRDDLKVILDKHNSTWRYHTTEFYEFMFWLKAYNEKHTDKIHLYGCEMQYVISDVNRVKEYLKAVNSDYQIDGFEKHLWQSIGEKEKMEYYNAYMNLKQ